jgi:hypothetical protein
MSREAIVAVILFCIIACSFFILVDLLSPFYDKVKVKLLQWKRLWQLKKREKELKRKGLTW